MRIECKLIREGGTTADIDGVEYHFAPQADGAHVADVENEDHVDRFLGIGEAYKLYRGKADTEEAGDDIDALKAAYTEKFGKAPHHKLSAAKIKEALAE